MKLYFKHFPFFLSLTLSLPFTSNQFVMCFTSCSTPLFFFQKHHFATLQTRFTFKPTKKLKKKTNMLFFFIYCLVSSCSISFFLLGHHRALPRQSSRHYILPSILFNYFLQSLAQLLSHDLCTNPEPLTLTPCHHLHGKT